MGARRWSRPTGLGVEFDDGAEGGKKYICTCTRTGVHTRTWARGLRRKDAEDGAVCEEMRFEIDLSAEATMTRLCDGISVQCRLRSRLLTRRAS